MANRKKELKATAKRVQGETKNKLSGDSDPGMIFWLMGFFAIMPFLYSRDLIDSVQAIRYSFFSAFILLFISWVFIIRKTPVPAFNTWPGLLKIIFGLGLVYGAWLIISMFGAINKPQTFYGIGRHFLNLIFLFIVAVVTLRSTDRILLLSKLLSVVAILLAIVGLGQFYESAFLQIPGNYPPYGIMANRNLFGTAQVLLLPFSIYSFYRSGMTWKVLSGISITAIIISSIISQTRSSWLSALAMVIVSLVLVIIFVKEQRKKWLLATAAAAGLTVLIALLLISSDPNDQLSQSLKSRTSIAITDTSSATSASGNVSERLKIWNKTMDVIKGHPLTGVGPGNWKLNVTKYGTEGLLWAQGNNAPDSPHNDYLLVAAESGIPGALFYFSMWLFIAIVAFRLIQQVKEPAPRVLLILMLSGIAGYATDSFFSFPMERMEHNCYLFLMAGIILGLYFKYRPAQAASARLPLYAPIIMVLVALANLVIGTKKMNFEKQVGMSRLLESEKRYAESVEQGNKAKNSLVSIAPNGFPVEVYTALGYKGLKKYPEALKEIDAAIRYSPYNKALYVNKGTIYTDMKQYDSAIKYYNIALKLAPEFDLAFYNLAINYYNLKEYKKALEVLNKTDLSAQPSLIQLKKELEAMPGIGQN